METERQHITKQVTAKLEGKARIRLITFDQPDAHGDVYKRDNFYPQYDIPIDLPGHIHNSGIVGRARLILHDDGVDADLQFHMDDPLAAKVARQIADGELDGFSWLGYQDGRGENIKNAFIQGITALAPDDPPANDDARLLTMKSTEANTEDDIIDPVANTSPAYIAKQLLNKHNTWRLRRIAKEL